MERRESVLLNRVQEKLKSIGGKIKGTVNAFKTDLPPDDPGTLEQVLRPDWLNEFSQPSEDK